MSSANLWAQFSNLLPKKPRLIGKINSVLGGDVYRVLFPDGQMTEVKSSTTYAVNDSIFVEGDQIVSKAPDLTSVIIEI